MFIYRCVGGPFDDEEVESRFPKGFLVVDRPNTRCWLYDFDESRGVWSLREDYPQPWDRTRSITAAEGNDYDVRAAR
jgi:hypothetical protein